jgi:hypothetical protein
MAGRTGFYSDIVIYDERNRYYYLWAQKNKPLLDDEIRGMGIGLLDQIRRSIQHTYGNIAAPNSSFSTPFSTANAFKVEESLVDNTKSFIIKGGSTDNPAVLYARGFYIFINNDIEYLNQAYTSGNVDLADETDKSKTITPTAVISPYSTPRIDIVYISLKFAESTAVTGTNTDVYLDTGLKNPVVGTETANRLRAVFDVKVRENWDTTTYPIGSGIFDAGFFTAGITDDNNPTDNEYRIPIAAIYRNASEMTNSSFVDLLNLYNKRIFSLEELTYRLTHGGYSTDNLMDQGLTGFSKQFPNGVIDEGALATGLNQGIDTEAFNSNSITPRIIDNDGNFLMGALMLGGDTGLIAAETGPVDLQEGEFVAKDISARSVYIGYGETGITGMREYTDALNVINKGETGKVTASITNFDGETGSLTMSVKALQSGSVQNFYSVDYMGRVGLNTWTPGWEVPDPIWNVERYNDGLAGATGVNITLDVNDSARIKKNLFVDQDMYVKRDMFGKTWRLPEHVSHETPLMIGFTGIPQATSDTGVTGAVAFALFKRGVAVLGETGLEAYGYTGAQVAYEAYDAEGTRLFTIGDFGYDYDRNVQTLYGTGSRQAFLSNVSLLELPSLGSIQSGDVVTYDLILADSSHVTGAYTAMADDTQGISGLIGDILNNSGFPAGATGANYSRLVDYVYHNIDGTTEMRSDWVYGAAMIEDPYGYTGLSPMQHGRIVLKDLVASPEIDIESIASFTIARLTYPTASISFTPILYYGSGTFGGDFANVKYMKFDLGEGAQGWLFNGDVYFNGNGLLNRVTFSPNAIFRDDIFVYGTIYSDEQVFNFASVQSLYVRNRLTVDKTGQFKEGVSIGEGADATLTSLRGSDSNVNLFVKGKAVSKELILRGDNVDDYEMGKLTFTNLKSNRVYAYIGGTQGSSTDPFGLHIIDDRSVEDEDKFKTFTIDFSDGRGNYSDVSLVLDGDLSTGRYFQTQYLGVGPITEINTDYRFQVEGRALINDVLEVKALRFVGAEAPEGIQDITDPANIATIVEGGEVYQNNQIILREKKFTSTKRIYLNNNNGLGYTPLGGSGAQYYYEEAIQTYYDTGTENNKARWAFDNVSYLESQFDEIVENDDTSPNEIIVEDITISKYKKYRCERIRLATLGTLTTEWSGYRYEPGSTPTTDSVIQQYYFSSPYFRNRDSGITIDWFPENDRFGDDNFVVKIDGTFTDSDPVTPSMFSFKKPICLYIKKSAWWQYYKQDTTDTNYRSFAIFYPYEHVTQTLNINDIVRETSYSGSYTEPNWKISIYPRLTKQSRVTVGNNQDKLYTGEWSMDLVLLPESTGRVANLVGDMAIGYYQS